MSSSGSKDRLKDLNKNQVIQNNNNSEVSENVEITIDEKTNQTPELRKIFEKVHIIRIWIGTITENTKVIEELTKNNLTSKKLINNEIETRVKSTTSLAFKISNKLKELNVKDIENDKSALTRIQRIQYGTLRQEFQNALCENNNILEKYRDRQKFLLQKQATLVNSALTDEEIEAIIDNPNGTNIFTDNFLMDTQHAKDQLAMLEERHDELIKIEKLLEEIRDQFIQMAILVEQQKEHVNRIEYHASDAIDYVDQGLIDLQKANRKRKKNKKMMYITIFCIVFILLILLMIFMPRL